MGKGLMPIFDTKIPKYKPAKDIDIDWDNFRGGLNTLLRETELKGNDLAQADNLMLVGAGVPTKRWGSSRYYMAGATGSARGFSGYYNSGGSVSLLAITDDGYLTKKSGASYSVITGASWASGYYTDMAQLDDYLYIVHPERELVKTDAETLTSFPTISKPTGTFATQFSGASGTNTYSYRVSVTTEVGETLATDDVTTDKQPQNLADGQVRLTWTAPSAASGTLVAFNIYGRDEGNERFLGSVDWQSTTFDDDGSAIPSEFTYPPTADTTGGIKCKYIERFQDRLIYAGIDGDPSKVVVSGRVPLHESNDLSYGGNYIRIEPDAGDSITGLKVFENKIIVFKERSIWEVVLGSTTIGNYFITIPQAKLVTQSHGCIAPRSISAVENDIFFLSREGVFILGYEPNILNVLRTNELSAKVRDFFENTTPAQKEDAVAIYYDKKYIIGFPGKSQAMVFDRERNAWVGPWSINPNVFGIFFDSNNNRRLLLGEIDSTDVLEMSGDYGDDNGTIISTILRTKKEDFGNWSVFKTIKDVFFNFRNVTGDLTVDIKLEDRDGNVKSEKSFAINPILANSGWGADLFSNTLFADTEETGGSADLTDIVRWAMLNKASRSLQIEIKTTQRNDDYELLGIRAMGKPISKGYNPSSWKV